MSSDSAYEKQPIPVKQGLVSSTLGDGGEIDLLGSQCNGCGEASIGTNAICLNCGGTAMEEIIFSRQGVLWTYTIVRHRPPGEYLGFEDFQPFGLGLVELPEGVRVMVPLEGDVDRFHIGMQMQLKPWILSASEDKSYLAFRFAPVTH